MGQASFRSTFLKPCHRGLSLGIEGLEFRVGAVQGLGFIG